MNDQAPHSGLAFTIHDLTPPTPPGYAGQDRAGRNDVAASAIGHGNMQT